MNDSAAMTREIDALRARLSALSAASLRISTSLDLQTVLGEVAGSARSLTGARYAAIATIDDGGRPVDFVTSGFTVAEHRAIEDRSDGPLLFEHFRDLDGPLRIDDAPAYVGGLGFPAEALPGGPFVGMPMRHRARHVGNFYLVGKEAGGTFTEADEELLVMFASQAGTAIANARTHRAERRAREDLEAVVETCPVGVVVFDAVGGRVASMNREAERLVRGLCAPDQAPEALLGVITCRRADGREIALESFPLADALGGAETVRAEEIELSMPGGESVGALINVTPIRDEDGATVSVVVALQDLAPLRALERQRAEFLGMVSHELRAPLTSIKGSTATVLGGSRMIGSAEIRQFFRIIDRQANRMDALIGDLLDAGRIEAGTLSVAPEPTNVAMLVDQARNTFITGGGRHPVLLDLPEHLPQVLADRERVVQVLNNLLANAARAAPESSPILVGAAVEGVHVALWVADEGRGMEPARIARLFTRRPASGNGVDRAPGGGLGLAICRGLVEAHGGRIRAESGGIGAGLRVTFTIPAAHGERPSETRARSGGHDVGAAGLPILVVDDDLETLRHVRDALAEAGFAPVVTADHREIDGIMRAERPRLVLLDLMLPDTDGIELMRALPALAEVPIVFISGYGRDETIARALEGGAEDYIVKPFSPTELVARVRAALRRRSDPERFEMRGLAIDYERRRVSVDGRDVALTVKEFDLLSALSLNAGRVSTHDWLLGRVWEKGRHDNPKIVRAYVKRLRGKLGDNAADPKWIFNERGVGYVMPRSDGG